MHVEKNHILIFVGNRGNKKKMGCILEHCYFIVLRLMGIKQDAFMSEMTKIGR